jgi:hypothetical protein
MLRKMFVAALAVVTVALSAPQAAQARGGFHGGGGWHGGGWHGGGHWHGGGFWPGLALGAGIAGYGYYGYGYPYYGDPYYAGTGYNGGYGDCYVARKRVMTKWGWRVRLVDVCE